MSKMCVTPFLLYCVTLPMVMLASKWLNCDVSCCPTVANWLIKYGSRLETWVYLHLCDLQPDVTPATDLHTLSMMSKENDINPVWFVTCAGVPGQEVGRSTEEGSVCASQGGSVRNSHLPLCCQREPVQ